MQNDQQPQQPDAVSQGELPVSPGRAIIFGLCALAVGWGVTDWLSRDNDALFVGVVAAPTTSLAAPVDGRLIQRTAAEHDIIHAGGSVAVIEKTHLAAKIARHKQRVNRLQHKLEEVEARADVELAWRQKDIQGEIHATQIEAANLLKQKLTQDIERLAWSDFKTGGPAAIRLTSTEKLFLTMHNRQYRSEEQQLRAALQEEAARNAAEVLNAQIELCDQRLAELRQLASKLPHKVKQAAGLDRLSNELITAEEELSHLELQSQQVTVIASAYGVVGLFHHQVGSDVARGETIVDLFDLDRRYLVARVPSSHLYRFAVDGHVKLRFPGKIKRTGRIAAIPPQADWSNATNGESSIAIRIEPIGKLWPKVPIGSTVQVRVGAE